MSLEEERDGDANGQCAAEIRRLKVAISFLEAAVAARDTYCEWREDDSGELYDGSISEVGRVYASCRWVGYWEGPAPSFCPGCGHPVKTENNGKES